MVVHSAAVAQAQLLFPIYALECSVCVQHGVLRSMRDAANAGRGGDNGVASAAHGVATSHLREFDQCDVVYVPDVRVCPSVSVCGVWCVVGMVGLKRTPYATRLLGILRSTNLRPARLLGYK